VFLDRDGVINLDGPRGINRPEDLRLVPGAAAAIAGVRARGWLAVAVTNQSAVARGWLSPEGLAAVHARLAALLAAEGAALDGIYHCPHHPDFPERGGRPGGAPCGCRKPAPGMLFAAAAGLGICLARSVLVGDRPRDIEAGRAAGLAACRLIPSDAPGALAEALAEIAGEEAGPP